MYQRFYNFNLDPNMIFRGNRRLSNFIRINRLLVGISAALTGVVAPLFSNDLKSAEDQHPVIILETYVIHGEKESDSGQSIDSRSLNLPKIMDLSEIISTELIEASMVRKSGYGNEINLRGFSQANLPVLVNGGVLEGSCASRKDPALSHINMLTVNRLVIREGPFDVEQAGNLGGYVNVITKGPEEGFSGEILTRTASNDFRSAGLTVTGGSERIQARVGYNYSESAQYKDGNGNRLWELRSDRNASYNEKGQSANSFRKHDVWAALNYDLNDQHSILLEYSWGDARDILTSRVAFDTGKETTRLTRLVWSARELGNFSDSLKIALYRNDVGHFPTQKYRNVMLPKAIISKNSISGGSIRNRVDWNQLNMSYGVDAYQRKWNADVFNATTGALLNGSLIPDSKAQNVGAFFSVESDLDRWLLRGGIRVDTHYTEARDALKQAAKLTSVNKHNDTLVGGFASMRYRFSESSEIFAGIGRSYRVPNGAERYIQGSASYFGNPELEPSKNSEVDLGWKREGTGWRVQVKAFYSDLEDYIYQVGTTDGYQTYQNIDAHIYGGDLTGNLVLGSGFSVDAGFAIHRGKKDSQLDNNSDPDLGQMAPLKARFAINHERQIILFNTRIMHYSTLEWVHGNASTHVDSAAGEKVIDAWDVVNLRLGLRSATWSLIAGADNLFDKAYAVANSYEWDVMGGNESSPIIVNEPGRFIYISLGYRW